MKDVADYRSCRSYDAYQRVSYRSSKWSSYFPVYDRLFSRYIDKDIVFVEVGVFDGGSLQMWRNFFGDRARIIGIDANPAAKKMEQDGFEIHIGDQADRRFWNKFFEETGQIDVLLDDGGHTYEQQIITAESAIPFIRDGGLLVTEDTHTSYLSQFAGPSRNSFVSWCFSKVHNINNRFIKFRSPRYRRGWFFRRRAFVEKAVYAVSFFESIAALEIDRRLAGAESVHIENIEFNPSAIDLDYRYHHDFWAKVFGLRFVRISNFLRNQRLRRFFRP